jgi:hypothetical protein
MGRAERPAKSIQRDAGLDITVLCNKSLIIMIDEVKIIYLPENSKGNNS